MKRRRTGLARRLWRTDRSSDKNGTPSDKNVRHCVAMSGRGAGTWVLQRTTVVAPRVVVEKCTAAPRQLVRMPGYFSCDVVVVPPVVKVGKLAAPWMEHKEWSFLQEALMSYILLRLASSPTVTHSPWQYIDDLATVAYFFIEEKPGKKKGIRARSH